MHHAAMRFLHAVRPLVGPREFVAEFGSLDVNGSARHLFDGARLCVGVDVRPGRGVDVVADAADWGGIGEGKFDCILCTEVLEHTPRAAEVCANAHRLLRLGGVFLVTAAGVGRTPHSVDGEELPQGEFYCNVEEHELRDWLKDFATALIQVREDDIYALAVK